MLRLLRRSVAAASFLLLLATVALWVRSYWRGDEVSLTTYAIVPDSTPDPDRTSESYYRGELPEEREVRKEGEARDRAQRRTNGDYRLNLAQGSVHLYRNLYDFTWYPSAPGLNWESDTATPFYFGYEQSPLAGKAWGFLQLDHRRIYSGSGGSRDASREQDILFPMWALATPFAIAPTFWLTGIYRRQRRAARLRRQGKCAGCGYDMRASPQRCPECGRSADAASRAAKSDGSNFMPGWWRELLPLCAGTLLLIVLVGGSYLLISNRFAAMEQLYASDETQKAAAEAAETASKNNNAPALRAALTAARLYGPKETVSIFCAFATEKEKVELARVLLDYGVDVPHLSGEILYQAIESENYAYARLLIENGTNVNAPGGFLKEPPLACCVPQDDNAEKMAIFQLLLEKGANPNGRANPKAWTILHTLVQSQDIYTQRVRIAQMLIAKGADVNATADDNEMTPLILADPDSTDPLVKLLKSKGAKRHEKEIVKPSWKL